MPERRLSKRQRLALAALVAARRPVDVVGELARWLDVPATRSGSSSLLRSVRLLALNGLVRIEHEPTGRPGAPRVLASANRGADLVLTVGDVARGREAVRSTRSADADQDHQASGSGAHA